MDVSSLLESINQNISEAIFRSNEHGLVYVNPAFVKMFGFNTVEEVFKTPPEEMYKDVERRHELIHLLEDEGSFENEEATYLKKNGQEFVGLESSIRYEDQDGNVFWDGAIRDISDQKNSEKALIRQAEMQQFLIGISSKFINLPIEEFRQTISETLGEVGIFVEADRVYIFDYSDDGTECSYSHGWNREGIKPVKEGSQNIPIKGQLKKLLDNHFEGEHLFIPSIEKMEKGEQKDAFLDQDVKSLLSVPMIFDKKCLGFIGFDSVRKHINYSNDEIVLLRLLADMLVNAKIRVQDQNKLRKLLETTAEQNGRLKDFSYIISHNFRSSVANIEGLVGVLKDYPTNEEYMLMLQLTTSKLTDAISNINELLNFEKGVTDMDRQQTNVCKIIRNVLELNNKVIKEKGLEINVEVPDDLEISTIPVYLESIFHNLITNAIKYGTTATRKKINIKSRVHKKFVSLKVQDFGLGIDLKKYQDKVFKLGARFHANEGDGHGMGLFMTKHQVEALGGKIDVQSEVNVGTTFIVVFYG